MSEKPASTSYDPNTPFGRYIMRMLRRLFIYWPERAAVRKRSFVRRDKNNISYHKCEICAKEVPRKESHVDHIVPVIPLTGPDDWGNIMKRLFVSRTEMQNLCKECHAIKTKGENATRYKHRDKARRRKAKS